MIRHVYGDRFPLGEPSGETSADVQRLSDVFAKAGMQAPVLDRIRDEIWLKLWGNVCFNPISALTHATLDLICTDPGTRALSKAIMLERQAIAESFGVRFRVDVERRIEGARKVGAHKTSMLQDLERSRPMEIDPLVTVVQEMGRLTSIPTPALDAVLALIAQRAASPGSMTQPSAPRKQKPPLLHDGDALTTRRPRRQARGRAASCVLEISLKTINVRGRPRRGNRGQAMIKTRFTEMFGVEHPIVQGGMQWVGTRRAGRRRRQRRRASASSPR